MRFASIHILCAFTILLRSSRTFLFREAGASSDGDVVSPRLAPRRGRTENDSRRRRTKRPGCPRGRREHTSGRVVSFVRFATFLASDVAKRYGDQDHYGDPHPYADPDDLFIYTTVALP